MFYIPERFAHGFLILSDTAKFVYKYTDEYDPNSEGDFMEWKTINVEWPKLDCEYKTSDKNKGACHQCG